MDPTTIAIISNLPAHGPCTMFSPWLIDRLVGMSQAALLNFAKAEADGVAILPL